MAETTKPETPAVVEKPKKAALQSVFATSADAIAAAASRTKGPRRAFTCKSKDGKEMHVVANNEGRAGGIAFMQIGGLVDEIGKTKKAKAPLGLDAVQAAINQLPEADRKLVLEQLKALTAKK